ncbi:hypothetical protein U1Q18_015385 [Sarracenia purpurea var. burkii]
MLSSLGWCLDFPGLSAISFALVRWFKSGLDVLCVMLPISHPVYCCYAFVSCWVDRLLSDFVWLFWFIRPNVYWSMIRTTYDDGDEEGSSDEDVVETFMGASGVNIAGDATTRSFEEHDLDIDEFDYLLNKMSIIPKNSLNDRFGGELHGGTR